MCDKRDRSKRRGERENTSERMREETMRALFEPLDEALLLEAELNLRLVFDRGEGVGKHRDEHYPTRIELVVVREAPI